MYGIGGLYRGGSLGGFNVKYIFLNKNYFFVDLAEKHGILKM